MRRMMLTPIAPRLELRVEVNTGAAVVVPELTVPLATQPPRSLPFVVLGSESSVIAANDAPVALID
jgi:hypothetical protein